MGREKKNAPGAAAGGHAKERHKRDRKGNLIDWTAPLPAGLVARPDRPRVSSKHKSWFEFIENKDKKKKLEFEFTETREPPPGFEFVPIGNPALTTACKELSREQGAMIFIVTSSQGYFSKSLSLHLNRAGHHIRQTIVEQARASLGDHQDAAVARAPGQPEPIPERQEDIDRQADAAIRDLFPRIPNTDRQMIIEHAFNKSKLSKGDPPVGLASHLSLSRRVQLAVLAHIRHNHTRYDQLLKETSYVNARKAVESLCLDFLVKWRGDEETGRDQLDEILCEVIVISDSESDDSEEEDDEDESSDASSSADETPGKSLITEGGTSRATLPPLEPSAPLNTNNSRATRSHRGTHAPQGIKKVSRRDRRDAKWAQRGFGRYQAARDQAWHQAVERQRLETDRSVQPTRPMPVDQSANHGPQQWQPGEPDGPTTVRTQVEPRPYAQHVSYGVPLPSTDVRYEHGSAPSRVNNLQQTIPPAVYRMPQETRVQGDSPSNGLGPIVGSRPLPYSTPDVERQNAPFVARQPEGHRSDFQRQERVVGIEYIPARPSLEPRPYSELRPPYETGESIYRSRSTSTIPVPYLGPACYSQTGRPVPRRDEVITLD
ncbi:hypothetical protein MFIFM68171_03499 [Madurella fahalii]|uniref:DUF2293 domain-containing protein n=1 Tax=Madurella fahalii TaxID=1157608 RepID=A0ABQ0G6K5_9PEZI